MSTAVDAMSLARDERADLADLLTTLTPAQWDAPSLCTGWRVRDVVAHMFSYDELGVAALIGRFITGGVLPDRVNAAGVAAYADHSTRELDIPAERLHTTLQFARTTIGAAKRIRGLTLIASDLDWTAGKGPVVEGPAEALLMAIAGRRDSIGELSGPGQHALADRIGA